MSDARAHLLQLAQELADRDWSAQVCGRPDRPVLQVSNPEIPRMGESIVCNAVANGEMAYCWPWRQTIGPVSDVSAAADRISARRSTDPPGDFVASRMDDAAGPDRTVIRTTSAELDAALREQRELAARGTATLGVGFPP